MNCPEFLARFSDHVDGPGEAALRSEIEDHLASCASCRRYAEVFERGRALLKSFPEIEIDEDFRPRLRHRLYHVEDGEALSRGSSGSGTTAVTVVGMAVLLTLIAWSPLMRPQEPEVELSPIVVNRPTARALGLRMPGAVPVRERPALDEGWDLWEGSHLLLYEHSPLSEKYRGSLRRTGLD